MSEFSRETLLNIIETNHVQCGEASALARMALAAMDSEPVELPLDYLQGHKDGLEWAARLAEANHPETGDWLYDDPIELAKAIRKGPDMPPVQPVADSEPVIVVGDDGGDALSYRRLIQSFEPGTKLYRHAQPAPVVPDDVLAALQKVARIRLDLNDFDGDRRQDQAHQAFHGLHPGFAEDAGEPARGEQADGVDGAGDDDGADPQQRVAALTRGEQHRGQGRRAGDHRDGERDDERFAWCFVFRNALGGGREGHAQGDQEEDQTAGDLQCRIAELHRIEQPVADKEETDQNERGDRAFTQDDAWPSFLRNITQQG